MRKSLTNQFNSRIRRSALSGRSIISLPEPKTPLIYSINSPSFPNNLFRVHLRRLTTNGTWPRLSSPARRSTCISPKPNSSSPCSIFYILMSSFRGIDPSSPEQFLEAFKIYKNQETTGRYCAGALLVVHLYEILLTYDDEACLRPLILSVSRPDLS